MVNDMINRLLNLRQRMAKQDIQAVLIDKKQDCTYLSGFLGDDTFLFITHDNAYIITDFRYVEQAEKQAKGYEILRVENKIWQAIKDIISKESIKRIGIQEQSITYSRYKEYSKNLSNVEFISIDDDLKQIRMIKTKDEIEQIRKAVEIADCAFSHIIGYIKVGMTEEEVALELEYFMKKNKASGVSFETIVASGVRSSMPHGVASKKVIEHNDVITLDYGAIYNNYCSDMTRTIFMGQPKQEILKIYDIVKQAQQRGINEAKRGVLASDVDKASRDFIESMGYGKP